MQQRRSFVRHVPLPSLGVLLSAVMAAAAWAGEGVTFSDKRSAPRSATSSRSAGRRLAIENPLGSLDPGASSLQGFAAPPFAAPRPGPISPRERELREQRRDWIMQAPDSRLRNNDEVNRAFGVRDYSPENSTKEKEKESDQNKGALIRYYEKLESAESTPSTAAGATAEKETTDSLSPLGLERPPQYYMGSEGRLGPGEISGGDPMAVRLNDISAGLRNDPFGEAARQAGRWPKPFEVDRGGARRPALSFQSGTGGEIAGQPSGVERLLGASPIDNPVGRGSVSSLDPVTAYPDPTREALNPIVAPPVTSLGSPLQAGAAMRDRPLAVSPSSVMRDLGGNSLRGALGPASSAASLNQRRTLQSIKVQLDAPRRNF